MKRPLSNVLDRFAYSLAMLFALDRLLKLAAVIHFFRRPLPPGPPVWPSISLFQPITRGVSGLPASLRSRAKLDYPASIQHLLICDAHNSELQAECRVLLTEFPALQAEIVLVETNAASVASKTEKLLAAIPYATGEVFWFLDDDVALRPLAARILIPLPASGWSCLRSGLLYQLAHTLVQPDERFRQCQRALELHPDLLPDGAFHHYRALLCPQA